MTAPQCECLWDRYHLTCPHPFHQAVPLRSVSLPRLVTTLALSAPCPDFPPTWDDLR